MRRQFYLIIFGCCLAVSSVASVIPRDQEGPLALQGEPSETINDRSESIHYLDNWVNIRINSDNSGRVQNEQQVVVNPMIPGNVVAVWRDFRLGYRRVGLGRSFDNGFTWEDELFYDPYYDKQSDPCLTLNNSGTIYACNLSFNEIGGGDALMVAGSDDGGLTWSPWVASVANNDPDLFEDKQLIGCDRTDSPYAGNLYVTWARFDYDPYETTIMVVRSTDGGINWEPEIPVSDLHGVQWPVPAVGPNGEVYIGWVKYTDEAIHFDRSFDGGITWGNDIIVQNTAFASGYINPQLGIFAFPAMDVDITDGPNRGTIYIAYCDENFGDTDIFFTKSTDQGDNWSRPSRVNDDDIGNGADQFHPWLVCDEAGLLHLIFYDRRLDIPNNLYMDLFYTYSTDGGISWSPNERISDVSSNPANDSLDSGLIGEYNGLAVYEGIIHPVWTDTRFLNQDTFTAVWDTSTAIEKPAQAASGIPAEYNLLQVSPNPFNRAVRVEYTLALPGELELSVYDLAGKRVATLAEGRYAAGVISRIWEPDVSSGIYIVRASGPGVYQMKKTVYLK